MPRRELYMLITLAVINFTNILDFMIMMPLGPQFKRIFDLDPHQWSLLISSYTFTAFLSGLASLFFIDKLDRKPFLNILYIGFIVGTLLCGLANSYELLLAARVFTGMFGGVIGALVLAIVGDVVPPERRGRAMGIVMAGFSGAAALGVPLGLYLGTIFGWQMPFFGIVALGLPIYILMHYTIPNVSGHLSHSQKNSAWMAIKDAFQDKNQLTALIFMVFLLFGQFTLVPFLSPYMVANVGFTEAQLTYIYLAGGIVTIFSSPIIGKLSDKYGKPKVFTYLLLLSLIPILWITHMPVVSVGVVLIATVMFFMFAGGRMIPGTAVVLATAKPNSRGAFMSIRSAIQHLGSAVAAYIGGLIMVELPDGTFENYPLLGYIGVVTSLIALGLIFKIKQLY
jgi:predicted MFS family arabinose efflux permease